jgi:hypothetical protein
MCGLFETAGLFGASRTRPITGYVNADPDFTDEHLVITVSQPVRDVFERQVGTPEQPWEWRNYRWALRLR